MDLLFFHQLFSFTLQPALTSTLAIHGIHDGMRSLASHISQHASSGAATEISAELSSHWAWATVAVRGAGRKLEGRRRRADGGV